MWTANVIRNIDNELIVEFTSNSGHIFVKKYNINGNLDSFLEQKINNIETLSLFYIQLQNICNEIKNICDGWEYKITYVSMPADWIDIFIDIQSPKQLYSISKMYDTTIDIDSEINMIAQWINNLNTHSLSDYIGQEVTF